MKASFRVCLGLVCSALIFAVAVSAQTPPPPSSAVNLQQPIPFDAAVRTGTLSNGLTYFIRQNPRPENKFR